jgi:hexokinase
MHMVVNQLENLTENHCIFRFEKLYAGHYLGELVRLVLVKLTSAGVLYGGKGSDSLMTRWNLTTSHVTAIERYCYRNRYFIKTEHIHLKRLP